jgi:hypothetical protein
MRIKAPFNYMVTTLGSCVFWPLVTCGFFFFLIILADCFGQVISTIKGADIYGSTRSNCISFGCSTKFSHGVLGPLHAWQWRHVTIAFSYLSHWLKKVETDQVHFKLECEGLRVQRNDHGWKGLHGFLHGRLWMTFHGMLGFAWSPPWRGRFDTNSSLLCQ